MSGKFHSDATEVPKTVPADEKCGFGRCTPGWLQRFADPKFYIIVFSALGILQGAFFTYIIGVITTLEKRYAFESKVTGVILIADNLSPIFTSILIGYYANKVHKPRLIAGSMLLVVFACTLSALPYFIYGPGYHILDKQVEVSKDSKREYCDAEANVEECDAESKSSLHPAVYILFLGNFINGFGYTAFYTIGSPYLDDNIKKKNSPLYFSAMSALRIFGPTLGFLLSSFCLKYYEDPFFDPGIDPRSPQWVGAWWMGFFILGAALFVFTIPLAFFPRQLPARFRSVDKKPDDSKAHPLPSLSDFPKAIKRISKNPLLMCHVISITFQVNGFAGYFVFMPKFMESQYHQSASAASLFSGTTGIVSMLVGILLGGFMIKKFKPRPRILTGYMMFVSLFSVFGLLVSIFLGCPADKMPGTTVMTDETLDLYNACNAGCGCTRRVFEPVCGPDGQSAFFSPCFAGCPNATGSARAANASANATVFGDCKCVMSPNSTVFEHSSVTRGFCSIGAFCSEMFMAYIIVLSISKFVSSTGRVGDTLVTLRCVDAEDKSFALGIIGSVLSAFAFIPYPLIYGALTDSTCLVWEETCSKTGNCWLYDSDKFRFYLHGLSALLIVIGTGFEGVVFMLSDRITDVYGEEAEQKANREELVPKWLKEEEDEEDDILFALYPRKEKLLEMDTVY